VPSLGGERLVEHHRQPVAGLADAESYYWQLYRVGLFSTRLSLAWTSRRRPSTGVGARSPHRCKSFLINLHEIFTTTANTFPGDVVRTLLFAPLMFLSAGSNLARKPLKGEGKSSEVRGQSLELFDVERRGRISRIARIVSILICADFRK